MNELKIFENPEFGQIRAVEIDGTPYFVGKDIALALGYADTVNALKQHVDSDDKIMGLQNTTPYIIDSMGRMQYPTFINESGVYSLVFGSKLEEAKNFKHWVTSEVLPTIRKTGGYVSNEEMFINTYLPYANESTKLIFSQTLRTVREQNETIKQQRAEISHKEDVIIGLVEDIDLATKRQRITQIMRHGADNNYQDRYNLLYREFERKYHCDLKRRMQTCDIKPKIKNKMDYIDRVMNMIPQLYEVACKIFENDVEKLKKEWDSIVA
jgi:prophage antirepressor-like protein